MTWYHIILIILAIQGVAGVKIHTLPSATTSNTVSNAVSEAMASTMNSAIQLPAESFPGTGHRLGTFILPETVTEVRSARLQHFESNQESGTTVTATNLVTEAANLVQNSADGAARIATNTLNTCTRSGRGCENGIATARRAAEEAAGRLQNGADWLQSVSDNMPSPETLGLVSTAISVHHAVTQGRQEADDICYDDEGISAMLPIVSRSVGTLATGGASGVAFGTCTSATAPFIGPLSLVAGFGCSYYTQSYGIAAVSGITDRVHGRRRAMNHQKEVRRILRTIVKPSDKLFEWQKAAIVEAATKGLLNLGDAGKFWIVMTREFVDRMIMKLPGDLQAQGRAFVESHRNGEGDNRFMPTPTQVSSLQSQILSKWCLPVNWEEWLELWGTDNVLYHGYENAVIKDQQKRATHVVDILKNYNFDEEVTVVMMDGHLRQWGAILRQMKNEGFNLENVRLRIVDIVDSVNQWHELFLPKSYATVVHGTLEQGGIYAEEVPEKGVLYMNFCGLGRTNARLEARLEYLKNKGVLTRTIVSMSSRGGQNPKTYDWLKKEIGGAKEVCKRGKKGMGFHTFAFDSEDDGVHTDWRRAGKKRKAEAAFGNTD